MAAPCCSSTASHDCRGKAVSLAQELCSGPAFTLDPALAALPDAVATIATLVDQGSLAFDDEA
jgi:50S ribosomal protein L16 3-hydroxylase